MAIEKEFAPCIQKHALSTVVRIVFDLFTEKQNNVEASMFKTKILHCVVFYYVEEILF
jgi:hypothetical protein